MRDNQLNQFNQRWFGIDAARALAHVRIAAWSMFVLGTSAGATVGLIGFGVIDEHGWTIALALTLIVLTVAANAIVNARGRRARGRVLDALGVTDPLARRGRDLPPET
ncbi:MAG: hypothetical protein JO246_03605 [Frankiaceae bacterium]|nr:hypothetical protein [Frankiaceae bacterium]MBV9872184.1 hypothetical protein [Frankiaceae bacterium]